MSVVIETTLGDVTVDLYTKERPRACLNFLKLCKLKYYNYNLFHTVSHDFIAQTGDPTGSRKGGESIYGVLDGPLKRYFEAETHPRIKHTVVGLVSFVGAEGNMVGSQFFITLAPELSFLDEKHCVFGEVVEGFDVLELLNEAICDGDNRPYQDIRITHTVVLDDPFPDPERLRAPKRSPSPSAERLQGGRIAPDEEIDEMAGKSLNEMEEMKAEREAKARATILEMVGDIPDAEMAPPENVLFVCKLNPVTSDDDLEIIFSRFGKINSCEVIRDKKTGDSLQYAFIEFDDNKACEDAYFKMDNVLIDDRRIHVDFSQSVAKVRWLGKGRGVAHFDDKGRRVDDKKNDLGKGNYQRSNVKEKAQNNSPKGSPRSAEKKENGSPPYKAKRDSSNPGDKSPPSRRQKADSPPISRRRNTSPSPRRDTKSPRRREDVFSRRDYDSRRRYDPPRREYDRLYYRREEFHFSRNRKSPARRYRRSPSFNRRGRSPSFDRRRRSPSFDRRRRSPSFNRRRRSPSFNRRRRSPFRRRSPPSYGRFRSPDRRRREDSFERQRRDSSAQRRRADERTQYRSQSRDRRSSGSSERARRSTNRMDDVKYERDDKLKRHSRSNEKSVGKRPLESERNSSDDDALKKKLKDVPAEPPLNLKRKDIESLRPEDEREKIKMKEIGQDSALKENNKKKKYRDSSESSSCSSEGLASKKKQIPKTKEITNQKTYSDSRSSGDSSDDKTYKKTSHKNVANIKTKTRKSSESHTDSSDEENSKKESYKKLLLKKKKIKESDSDSSSSDEEIKKEKYSIKEDIPERKAKKHRDSDLEHSSADEKQVQKKRKHHSSHSKSRKKKQKRSSDSESDSSSSSDDEKATRKRKKKHKRSASVEEKSKKNKHRHKSDSESGTKRKHKKKKAKKHKYSDSE